MFVIRERLYAHPVQASTKPFLLNLLPLLNGRILLHPVALVHAPGSQAELQRCNYKQTLFLQCNPASHPTPFRYYPCLFRFLHSQFLQGVSFSSSRTSQLSPAGVDFLCHKADLFGAVIKKRPFLFYSQVPVLCL